VAKVGYTAKALTDLERLEQAASGARTVIASAVTQLADHPLIGPVVDDDTELRKLVISRGKTGYIALYRYDEARDEVMVAAIRRQPEAGFDEG
jgi:plasmid stabilization system protein ParE